MNKPREWWLAETDALWHVAESWIETQDWEMEPIFHVVEHGVYDAAANERDDLKEKLAEAEAKIEKLLDSNIYTNPMASEAFSMGHRACEKIVLPMITKERDDLKEKLAEAEAKIELLDSMKWFEAKESQERIERLERALKLAKEMVSAAGYDASLFIEEIERLERGE